MSLLIDSDRKSIWKDIMSELSFTRTTTNLLKTDLKAAVDAIDGWIATNSASFNGSLPLAARTNLTAKQKVRLFLFVVSRRWEIEV
jgi:hypothetical protein